ARAPSRPAGVRPEACRRPPAVRPLPAGLARVRARPGPAGRGRVRLARDAGGRHGGRRPADARQAGGADRLGELLRRRERRSGCRARVHHSADRRPRWTGAGRPAGGVRGRHAAGAVRWRGPAPGGPAGRRVFVAARIHGVVHERHRRRRGGRGAGGRRAPLGRRGVHRPGRARRPRRGRPGRHRLPDQSLRAQDRARGDRRRGPRRRPGAGRPRRAGAGGHTGRRPTPGARRAGWQTPARALAPRRGRGGRPGPLDGDRAHDDRRRLHRRHRAQPRGERLRRQRAPLVQRAGGAVRLVLRAAALLVGHQHLDGLDAGALAPARRGDLAAGEPRPAPATRAGPPRRPLVPPGGTGLHGLVAADQHRVASRAVGRRRTGRRPGARGAGAPAGPLRPPAPGARRRRSDPRGHPDRRGGLPAAGRRRRPDPAHGPATAGGGTAPAVGRGRGHGVDAAARLRRPEPGRGDARERDPRPAPRGGALVRRGAALVAAADLRRPGGLAHPPGPGPADRGRRRGDRLAPAHPRARRGRRPAVRRPAPHDVRPVPGRPAVHADQVDDALRRAGAPGHGDGRAGVRPVRPARRRCRRPRPLVGRRARPHDRRADRRALRGGMGLRRVEPVALPLRPGRPLERQGTGPLRGEPLPPVPGRGDPRGPHRRRPGRAGARPRPDARPGERPAAGADAGPRRPRPGGAHGRRPGRRLRAGQPDAGGHLLRRLRHRADRLRPVVRPRRVPGRRDRPDRGAARARRGGARTRRLRRGDRRRHTHRSGAHRGRRGPSRLGGHRSPLGRRGRTGHPGQPLVPAAGGLRHRGPPPRRDDGRNPGRRHPRPVAVRGCLRVVVGRAAGHGPRPGRIGDRGPRRPAGPGRDAPRRGRRPRAGVRRRHRHRRADRRVRPPGTGHRAVHRRRRPVLPRDHRLADRLRVPL
ncbi:MAG: Integral membrane indolylacetylinositol arabinosyltransferase, partial [uncultured Blastococcus sp.]